MDRRAQLELSEYEQQREPAPLQNGRVIELGVEALEPEVLCPICLSVMTNPMSTMECLHRFCSECISKSLRFGKKECPTCRHPCPSRRSLRADTAMQGLIGVAFPDMKVYEEAEDDVLQAVRKRHKNNNALMRSINEGMQQQALSRRTRQLQKEISSVDEEAKSWSGDINKLQSALSHSVHRLHILPHPKEKRIPAVPRQHLAVPSRCLFSEIAAIVWKQWYELAGCDCDEDPRSVQLLYQDKLVKTSTEIDLFVRQQKQATPGSEQVFRLHYAHVDTALP
eukprot:m.148963 g.148963  ORF g.148963 m.148963 type:complete len:281 (+) comp20620_c2_seq3:40-882(+)